MAIGGNPCGCPEGITNCEEAYECIITHICPNSGIRVDETQNCFGVALGSCLGFDAQGRIAYICGGQPAPSACQRTIAQVLADGEFLIGGRLGGAANLVPWGSDRAIEYALAHDVNLIQIQSFALDDGIAAWAPQDRATSLQDYTTNPADDAWARPSSEWVNFVCDIGTQQNFTGRSALAPAARRTPDGGFYGFGMREYSPLLATKGLELVAGRSIVNFHLPSGLPERIEDVNAVIDAINTACAQAWTMIAVGNMDLVAPIVAANITACVHVENVDIETPAQVLATGATWVQLRAHESDATIAEWVASGLNVLVRTNSRQYETDRLQALGVAGIYCNDPVYASDNFPDQVSQSWAGRGTSLGVLDYRSDQQAIIGKAGYTINAVSGIFMYNSPAVAAQFPTPPTALFQNMLMGMLRPSDPATDWPGGVYSFTWNLRAYWDTLPTVDGSRMGMAICSNFDTDVSGNINGLYGTRYRDIRSGYFLWVDVEDATGNMRIERIDPGGITPLAFQGSTVPVVNSAAREYTISVTPTTIRLERSDGVFVEATDSTYRGKWMFACTQFANNGTNTDTWETGFSFTTTWGN